MANLQDNLYRQAQFVVDGELDRIVTFRRPAEGESAYPVMEISDLDQAEAVTAESVLAAA